MMNQSAQGLASLGRNGDSMLMHVTPREVAGLQGLAMAHGGSLTINPQTGLPEAGFLDGIVDFALPIVGGFFGLPPWATAALMGGKSLIQGDDPLQAAMSAFGGYTGGKFGSGIKEFATPLKAFSPDAPVGDFAKSLDTKNLTGLAKSPPPIEPLKIAQTGYTGPAAPNFGAPKSLSTGIQGNIDLSKVTQGTGVQNLGSPEFLNRQQVSIPGVEEPVTLAGGVSKVFNDPVGFARQVGEGDALMGGAQLGLYAGKPFIENALTPEPYPGYIDPEKGKYRSDTGGLSLNPKYSTGLKLLPNLNAKEGGYIDGYATGGTIQSGGIRDLYGTPDNQPTISPGLSGFGLGRLNNLAGEQAMTQAQTLGYADGGGVVAGERGMNLDALPSLNVNTGTQSYGGGMGDAMYSFNDNAAMSPIARMLLPQMSQSDRAKFLGSGMGAFFGMQERPKQDYYTSSGALTSSYADGGDVGMNIEKQQALNLDRLPSLNVNTGEQGYGGKSYYMTPDGNGLYAGRFFKEAYRQDPNINPLFKLLSRLPDDRVFTRQMAKGGYLDGQGDGMSDSIPATIEGKQPARLADGEFVIPADVVSHLGNGSSKAGSKRLYAMLDKVRHARTGTKKQGKQINPSKYMPA